MFEDLAVNAPSQPQWIHTLTNAGVSQHPGFEIDPQCRIVIPALTISDWTAELLSRS